MRPALGLIGLVSLLALAAALGGGGRGRERPLPGPLFERALGVLPPVEGGHCAFADLDGDGDPDAILDRMRVFLNVAGEEGRRFVPVAQDFGPAAPQCVQAGDVDGDGRADLFFGRYLEPGRDEGGPRNEIWLGRGDGTFRRVERSGVGERIEGTLSACFVDYDSDGLLDLVVANTYVRYGKGLEASPSRLFRGRGDGTFEDLTERAGLLGAAEPGRAGSRRPTYGVAHTDWNGDGRQDLLALSYGRQANRLWRNDGRGPATGGGDEVTFTDVGEETGFAGDDERGGTYSAEVKARFAARGIALEDEPPFRVHGNTFDAAVADYDGDGDMDVFLAEITHSWAGPSSDLSMLLENLGPEEGWRFRRRPELIPRERRGDSWNQGDRHAGWLDVENDGRLDLLIASTDYPDEQVLRLFRQREDGAFEDWTDRLGFRQVNASQISLADFDRDGATDILVATNAVRLSSEQRAAHDLSIKLYRNVAAAAAGNRFLSLRLAGGGRGRANRDAVGARVTLWAGGRRQTREVYGGLGHAGHRDDAEVRFGLGRADVVDRLEVRWPDAAGSVQVFERVPASRFYVLEQGGELQ